MCGVKRGDSQEAWTKSCTISSDSILYQLPLLQSLITSCEVSSSNDDRIDSVRVAFFVVSAANPEPLAYLFVPAFQTKTVARQAPCTHQER
jgi:hypothetical protein